MKTYPLAKINLGLYVVATRPDGYHDLETVFYPIPLTDTLEVCPALEDSFTLVGLPLEGGPQDNLVMRVLALLRSEFPIPPVKVRLEKSIPSGAGLGGGSSDAAEMMKTLNTLFCLGLTNEQMEERVATLGADCAFFIKQQPVKATGIGNIFTPLALSLKGYTLVLVKPHVFVSTREAYAHVVPKAPNEPLLTTIRRPVEEWKTHMTNDFEESVFPLHPILASLKDQLYSLGATFALMSGSGSTLFALFRERPSLPKWENTYVGIFPL